MYALKNDRAAKRPQTFNLAFVRLPSFQAFRTLLTWPKNSLKFSASPIHPITFF